VCMQRKFVEGDATGLPRGDCKLLGRVVPDRYSTVSHGGPCAM
jgi:hypothetical protein